MNMKNFKNIYMIGIKGVGMTMLAQYLSQKDFNITGSDNPEAYMTDQVLRDAGIKVFQKFSVENIPLDSDLIIYSSAYSPDNNEEVAWAKESKIKTIAYAEALAMVFNELFGIAVIGTHGKTTTSAWLAFVMDRSGLNPSAMIGANVPQFKGAALVGKSDYLVAEADEYQNKLRYFNPKAVLLNNIEYDHPDYFKDKESYRDVFIEFIKKIPRKGFLVANFDDKQVKSVAAVNCRAKIISYAVRDNADYIAYDISETNGKQYFKVKLGVDEFEDPDEIKIYENNLLGDFSIRLAGRHNVYNALAVIAACIEMDIDLVTIRTHLEEFTGTSRRMEILGEYKRALIIDDYAHHPTEISATLAGIKERYPNKNIKVVFHPHTFSRTMALLQDFATAFNGVDELIVLDIYGSAREQQGGIHSLDIVREINNHEPDLKVSHIPDLKECEKYLRNNLDGNDVLVLMGAGDVFRIGENLVK
jgi:UDP-N-acetylmuramate--alanine ligase